MGTQFSENYNGHPLTIFTIPQDAGSWHAKAELDLGRTGHIIFENDNACYRTELDAKEAVLAMAAEGLACSRIGKSNS